VTLDEHGKQVGAVGLAYAIALLERAPANWLRPALLFDLHMLLDELTNDEPNAALNVARAHAKKLLKEMTPNELHWVSNTEGADASRRAKPLNHPRLLPSVPLPAQAEIAARRKPHPEESEMKKRNRKKPEPGDILRYRSRPRNGSRFSAIITSPTIPVCLMARMASATSSAVAAAAGPRVHVAGARREAGWAFTMRPPPTSEINTSISRQGWRRSIKRALLIPGVCSLSSTNPGVPPA
jgi:hypothetical protein